MIEIEVLLYLLIINLLLLISVYLPNGSCFVEHNNLYTNKFNSNFTWNWKILVILLSFALFIGFRDLHIPGDNSLDFKEYLKFYDYILRTGKIPDYLIEREMGYSYLVGVFALNGIPARVFFVLYTVLLWIFFFKGTYKFQFLLPLILFFVITDGLLFWSENAIRQAMALMIFFYSLQYIIDRKILKYLLILVIASLFHESVLLMFPLYFLNSLRFNTKIIFSLYILSIFTYQYNFFIADILNETISSLNIKFGLFSSYVSREILTTASKEVVASGVGIIVAILTNLYILYRSKSVLEEYPLFNIYYILFAIFIISNNIFFGSDLIGRTLVYFKIALIVVLPLSIYFSRNRFEKWIGISIMSLHYIIFFGGFFK
ncbi:EpsG family protein [Arcobacter arenosus]|uniref:EpsG family protein n=1 Tax=Arcobacter arenosus TaxID=2576037 RepID=UPI003BA97D13